MRKNISDKQILHRTSFMIWNGFESNYFKLFPNLLHTIQYTQARFICKPSCATAPDKCS